MSTLPQGDRPQALAILAFQGGPRYREELPVPSPVVTIGRGAQCDVVLADDSVSAVHARLEFDAGRWRLTDLESTNGTTVEGVKLAANVPTPVHYGVSMRFGGVTLLFREVDEADPEAARAAYVPAAPATTLREERSRARFPVWLVALVIVIVAVLVALFVFRGAMTAQPHPAPAPAAHAPPLARAAP
ncbi:MAG: hypothetical protein JWM27_3939 [Gemmatimonadetes bacterium]|nr:hypothetical protein [Gemmatimonadota bacterium]